MVIADGYVFDTPFEQGCLALGAPDKYGWFDGLDSEGVICSFSVVMVVGHPLHQPID
jgi:hypothetical protein